MALDGYQLGGKPPVTGAWIDTYLYMVMLRTAGSTYHFLGLE